MQLHVRVAVGPSGTERTLVVDGCEAGSTTVGEVKKKLHALGVGVPPGEQSLTFMGATLADDGVTLASVGAGCEAGAGVRVTAVAGLTLRRAGGTGAAHVWRDGRLVAS